MAHYFFLWVKNRLVLADIIAYHEFLLMQFDDPIPNGDFLTTSSFGIVFSVLGIYSYHTGM
jgi:hypothetical protein